MRANTQFALVIFVLKKWFSSKSGPAAQQLGREGERAAERLLKGKGYRVLERNWRHRRDEIDVICFAPSGCLVFVEVRSRKAGSLVGGYHSVGPKKKQALLRVCRAYLYACQPKPRTHRFDIIELAHEDGAIVEMNHFEDVPLFSKSLNRGAR